MIVKTPPPFDNAMKIPDINILELFVNKYPSNSDFYMLTLFKIFYFLTPLHESSIVIGGNSIQISSLFS